MKSKRVGDSTKKHKDDDEEDRKGVIVTVRSALKMLKDQVNVNDERELIDLCKGDPSCFPVFKTSSNAVEAVLKTLQSGTFNGYTPASGTLVPTQRAVAEHISNDLPYNLSPNDVYLTLGCKQAIEAIIISLSRLKANILMPRPGFAMYDELSEYSGVELHPYDLSPEKGWEIDFNSVEAAIDDNTYAIVIINPGNPCGTVYSYQHLEKVAETARKHGLFVIADEVYEHIVFGSNPFVRMGVFASKVPVITLGSISKRWMVPGWRLGWFVIMDPNGFLHKSPVMKQLQAFFKVYANPPTFIQAAVPEILGNTTKEFFQNTIDVVRKHANISYEKLKEIPCLTCPNKPEGSMYILVKIDVSMLDGIQDDMDFSFKLAAEENLLVLPGSTMKMKNWIRITFGNEQSALEDAFQRMKTFCHRNRRNDQ